MHAILGDLEDYVTSRLYCPFPIPPSGCMTTQFVIDPHKLEEPVKFKPRKDFPGLSNPLGHCEIWNFPAARIIRNFLKTFYRELFSRDQDFF